jgi:uncharacterized protein (TIGR00106 family)
VSPAATGSAGRTSLSAESSSLILAPATPTLLAVGVLRPDMTVVALLSVAPVIEDSMASEVAKAVAALDDFDVSYETNPMGTVIEADDIGTLFDAAQAAHEAVDGDRVSTVLKIDDKRTREFEAREKVDAVEQELGREAKRERER